ncbi:MAG: hypothetical protein KDC98_16330 [Planctomycetes bacterium]|nr:hypothetical protein [Planctomycetota bacterium]
MTHYLGTRLEWSDAAGFARCPSVVVCYGDNFNMVSNWIDAIVVTRTKRGRFSVYCRKLGESTWTGRGRVWETWDTVTGLRSGAELVKALVAAETYLSIALDWEDALQELALLDWCTAAVAANEYSQEWPKVDPARLQADLESLSPDQVQQVLEGIESWNHPDILSLLRLLHQKCGTAGGRSASAWRWVEERLFGDPTRIVDGAFDASLMDGPSVDLLEVAGLPYSDELSDAVWANHNWQSLLDECRGVLCEEVGEQDDIPGMSDAFYSVGIDDSHDFARDLRECMVKCAIAAASGKR